jgi:hypothetical protein
MAYCQKAGFSCVSRLSEDGAGVQRGDMPVIPKEPLEWLNLFRQQMNEIFRYLSENVEGREGGGRTGDLAAG